MKTIFLIWRIDFDVMEKNDEPISRKLLGFCHDTNEARAVVEVLRSKAKFYRGLEDGHGGLPTTYPKFDVVPTQELNKEGA